MSYFAIICSTKKLEATLEVSEVLITHVTNGGKAKVMLHISWTQGQDSSPDLEFFKRENKRRILHEKVHQTDSNLGPHNHQFNALTTRLATAAAQLTENLCYLWTNLINININISVELVGA